MAALVGRDTEMARLRGLLEDAVAGRAVTALVGGDAGVGKSRLVAEVMSVAAAMKTMRRIRVSTPSARASSSPSVIRFMRQRSR